MGRREENRRGPAARSARALASRRARGPPPRQPSGRSAFPLWSINGAYTSGRWKTSTRPQRVRSAPFRPSCLSLALSQLSLHNDHVASVVRNLAAVLIPHLYRPWHRLFACSVTSPLTLYHAKEDPPQHPQKQEPMRKVHPMALHSTAGKSAVEHPALMTSNARRFLASERCHVSASHHAITLRREKDWNLQQR